MNSSRRRQLQSVIEKLSGCSSELEMLRNEEQEAYDKIPVGLQMSERGESIENAISELESAIESIEDSISSIETAIE